MLGCQICTFRRVLSLGFTVFCLTDLHPNLSVLMSSQQGRNWPTFVRLDKIILLADLLRLLTRMKETSCGVGIIFTLSSPIHNRSSSYSFLSLCSRQSEAYLAILAFCGPFVLLSKHPKAKQRAIPRARDGSKFAKSESRH